MENIIKGQKAAIWKDLKAGKTLNPLMAVYEYGTLKLSTRCGELEKEKLVKLNRQRMKVRTRFGHVSIQTYSI